MTFPSIDPKIVEKIIALDKAGHGRNQIDRELKEQGVKVSRGSITNVIKRYKARIQQPIQENTSSIHPRTTINSATPLSITGSSILQQPNGVELLTSARDGGPLSHLIGNSTNEMEETKTVENLLIKDPKVDVKVNDIINQYAAAEQRQQQIKTIKEEEKQYYYQPETSDLNDTPAKDPPGPPIAKDPPNSGFPDWDSDENWEGRVIRYYTNDKKERKQHEQLMEQRMKDLQEEQQRLTLMMEMIEQKNNDLKTREAKITEVEFLIPLARQFQMMKVDVGNFIPWAESIQEYAVTHNTDLTTAAFDIVKNLRAWKDLEAMHNAAEKIKQQVASLDALAAGKQAALTTIMNLQILGFSETEITEWVELVSKIKSAPGLSQGNGHGVNKKLDTKLITDRN